MRIRITDALAPPKLLPVALYVTPQGKTAETKAQRDARLAWWREARFGMFIHWGLYAIPAGEWKGTKYGGGVEWIMNMAKIPVKEYEPLAERWNPTKFDAREWVRVAKDAGMKYIVITSKHHEGFGLWPSKQGDWNVKRTPFKDRDVLKELAAACKEAGIRLCFYHSIMDWHHSDYLPKRAWDKEGEAKADFDRYVAYIKAQLKELLTDYGDIGILWFDGEWEGTWTSERGQDLYNFVRSIQPKIIINNRVSKGRNGMQGMTEGQDAGDYGTPEQEIPANGIPGIDWESCMTMNDTWGYSAHDHNWKSAQTLVRNLIDCASKGGNYLLNVGPKAEGTIPQESVERLAQVGQWMKLYGNAIYGTSAGPFPKPLPWGRITRKGNHLYLQVFEAGSKILLPGFKADVVSVKEMAGQSLRVVGRPAGGAGNVLAASQYQAPKDVPFRKTEDAVELDLSGLPRAAFATVYDMTVRGPVEVVAMLSKQTVDGAIDLLAADATVHGSSARLEGDKKAIGYWTDPKDTVGWSFEAVRSEVDVEIEYACEPGSEGAEFTVEVGGQTLRGKVESTGSWSTFRKVKVGRVAIVVPGKTELVVRPISKPGLGVMNLRAVRLSP
ncbi:alpha-L-fucosidase [bacterium]|nr:MAG: alpha-L-fucosidase [bacterium]